MPHERPETSFKSLDIPSGLGCDLVMRAHGSRIIFLNAPTCAVPAAGARCCRRGGMRHPVPGALLQRWVDSLLHDENRHRRSYPSPASLRHTAGSVPVLFL